MSLTQGLSRCTTLDWTQTSPPMMSDLVEASVSVTNQRRTAFRLSMHGVAGSGLSRSSSPTVCWPPICCAVSCSAVHQMSKRMAYAWPCRCCAGTRRPGLARGGRDRAHVPRPPHVPAQDEAAAPAADSGIAGLLPVAVTRASRRARV
jgi:hypothetical protein